MFYFEIVGPVLDGLGQVLRQDIFTAGKIRDGAGHPEDPVVTAGGEAQPVKGAFHQLFPGRVQLTEAADLVGAHLGVGDRAPAGVPPQLALPGGVDPLPDGRAGFRRRPVAQILELHGRDVDVHVDAVQQRPGDLGPVRRHALEGAGAPPRGVAEPAAFAGVHGAHQHEPAGIGDRPGGAGDGDAPVLDGLAQGLDHVPVKFRQLIQKEDAVVGQGDLPRLELRPAGHGRVGQRVVRGAEGPLGQDMLSAHSLPGHRVDGGGLQLLLTGHIRQDGGQALGQHGFSGPRGADEQYVMGQLLIDEKCRNIKGFEVFHFSSKGLKSHVYSL